MQGFRIEGKAYCVCDELRAFAEKHKGITVGEFLKILKAKRLRDTINNQLDEIITQVNNNKREGE